MKTMPNNPPAPAPIGSPKKNSRGLAPRKRSDPSPILAAWGAAHRAVALTWIVGTPLLLGGIAVFDQSPWHQETTPPTTDRSRDPDRFRDAATIALASAAIAHVALLPGSWIGRHADPTREHASPDLNDALRDRERESADRKSATPSPSPSHARQSVAGDHHETRRRTQNDAVTKKKRSDGHDGVVAWFAGTLIRLFGTVALVGCYRYQLSEHGDPSFPLFAIVGWYLVLTFVEVSVLAKVLPAQDRPLS